MKDVVVVGGGVVGLSIAFELASRGVQVEVIEQSQLGREASWAGAGILPPGRLAGAKTPVDRLRALSAEMWSDWSDRIVGMSGVQNGFTTCGGLEIRTGEGTGLDDYVKSWQDEGVRVDVAESGEWRQWEPTLSPHVAAAVRLPEKCQVRNPRHLKALVAACAEHGVQFRLGAPVVDFGTNGCRVNVVRTTGESVAAGSFVVTAGAWSTPLLCSLGQRIRVTPVRGQMVMLRLPNPPIRHVIGVGPRYVVPRPDGRVLVGSTEEWVGFDKRTSASGVAELIRFAVDCVPGLADAELERTWAGLRPGSTDGLPYLGAIPEFDNAYIAAGHFRSGLQMSPGTARLVSAAVLHEEPDFSLAPYAVDRPESTVASVLE